MVYDGKKKHNEMDDFWGVPPIEAPSAQDRQEVVSPVTPTWRGNQKGWKVDQHQNRSGIHKLSSWDIGNPWPHNYTILYNIIHIYVVI